MEQTVAQLDFNMRKLTIWETRVFQRSLLSSAGNSFRSSGEAAAMVSALPTFTTAVAMILDTKENIFGRFTPVEWESRKPIS
jgi:hypothetical protein